MPVFRPNFCLPGTYTKIALVMRPKANIKKHCRREVFVYPDGGKSALDFFPKNFKEYSNKSIILVFPGVNGFTGDRYVFDVMKHISMQTGLPAVTFNFRGVDSQIDGDFQLTWGRLEDIDKIIKHLEDVYQVRNIYLVGLSMGANLVMNYLGQRGSRVKTETRIRAAVSISPPYDLEASSKFVNANKFIRKGIFVAAKGTFKHQLSSERTHFHLRNQCVPLSKQKETILEQFLTF